MVFWGLVSICSKNLVFIPASPPTPFLAFSLYSLPMWDFLTGVGEEEGGFCCFVLFHSRTFFKLFYFLTIYLFAFYLLNCSQLFSTFLHYSKNIFCKRKSPNTLSCVRTLSNLLVSSSEKYQCKSLILI